MKTIPLTQGQVAIVDDEDYERVMQYKWCAQWNPGTKSYYAVSHGRGSHATRKQLKMHRFIMGALPGETVDHRDHDTLDNQRHNLRKCSDKDNARNRRRAVINTTGFKGVSFDARPKNQKKPWCAGIKANGLTSHLGHHATAEDAARAYDKAAVEMFGEYACTNAALGLFGR